MNMPGFDAEASLGPTIGIYRGNVASGRLDAVKRSSSLLLSGTMHPALARGLGGMTPIPQEAAFTIPPPLPRYTQCTTFYSGYVTYPMRVCRPPNILPDNNLGFFDPGDGAGASGAMSQQVQFSPVPAIGQMQVEHPSSICGTLYGPWFASVVRQESCDIGEPDDFTLTISGAPQPVTLNWKGTMQDAPATVGALGNLSATVPMCFCCGDRKQCPDGSCVPLSVPCGPRTGPA